MLDALSRFLSSIQAKLGEGLFLVFRRPLFSSSSSEFSDSVSERESMPSSSSSSSNASINDKPWGWLPNNDRREDRVELGRNPGGGSYRSVVSEVSCSICSDAVGMVRDESGVC